MLPHTAPGLAVSLLTLERLDTPLDTSNLSLGAHAAPAERSRHGKLTVELVKLAARSVEFGVGWRVQDADSKSSMLTGIRRPPGAQVEIDHEWYAAKFRAALKRAGIAGYVRRCHDARHPSLTNGAAAGESPIALMARAGHRSMQTTNVYLHSPGRCSSEPTSPDLSAREASSHAGS